MNSDRELLELAAKAAGIALRPMAVKPAPPAEGDGFIGYMTDPDQWPRGWFQPLTDDGDALRLAVELRLDVTWTRDVRDRVIAMLPGSAVWGENSGDDPYAATRRAIVRAAAEIGRVKE